MLMRRSWNDEQDARIAKRNARIRRERKSQAATQTTSRVRVLTVRMIKTPNWRRFHKVALLLGFFPTCLFFVTNYFSSMIWSCNGAFVTVSIVWLMSSLHSSDIDVWQTTLQHDMITWSVTSSDSNNDHHHDSLLSLGNFRFFTENYRKFASNFSAKFP